MNTALHYSTPRTQPMGWLSRAEAWLDALYYYTRESSPSDPNIRLVALDRIWCRPPLSVRHSRVLPGARTASDHLPLIAELDWLDTSSPASPDGARSDGSC